MESSLSIHTEPIPAITAPQGLYGALCRGRRACAVACICGTGQEEALCGAIQLYTTPLGLLIFAEVKVSEDMAREGAVLCLCPQGPSLSFRDLARYGRALPLLYVKCGHAWGSSVTRLFCCEELRTTPLLLCRAETGGRRTVLGEVGWQSEERRERPIA